MPWQPLQSPAGLPAYVSAIGAIGPRQSVVMVQLPLSASDQNSQFCAPSALYPQPRLVIANATRSVGLESWDSLMMIVPMGNDLDPSGGELFQNTVSPRGPPSGGACTPSLASSEFVAGAECQLQKLSNAGAGGPLGGLNSTQPASESAAALLSQPVAPAARAGSRRHAPNVARLTIGLTVLKMKTTCNSGSPTARASLSPAWRSSWPSQTCAGLRGGERGIRTHGTLTGTPDFESGSFGHSDSSPPRNLQGCRRLVKPPLRAHEGTVLNGSPPRPHPLRASYSYEAGSRARSSAPER